jgi:3-isopropylmalate dehydratase small subunit
VFLLAQSLASLYARKTQSIKESVNNLGQTIIYIRFGGSFSNIFYKNVLKNDLETVYDFTTNLLEEK